MSVMGAEALLAKLNNMPKIVNKELKPEIVKSAIAVQNKHRALVQKGPATGRLYPRGRGRTHQASAPGEAPATDYGNLVRSLAHYLPKDDGLTAHIGSLGQRAVVAKHLEYGTKKMAPRLFIKRGLIEEAEDVKRFILRGTIKGVRRAIA